MDLRLAGGRSHSAVFLDWERDAVYEFTTHIEARLEDR